MHLQLYLCYQLTIMLLQGKFYHPTMHPGCPLLVWNISWDGSCFKETLNEVCSPQCPVFRSLSFWLLDILDPFLLKMGGIFNSSGPSFANRHDPCKFV